MQDGKAKPTFEEALAMLENAAQAMKNDDTKLEDALRLYEEGLKHYTRCAELLSEAKQRIMVFDKSISDLKEME